MASRTYPFDPYGDKRFAGNALPDGFITSPQGLRKFALALFIGDLGQLPPVLDTAWYGDLHYCSVNFWFQRLFLKAFWKGPTKGK